MRYSCIYAACLNPFLKGSYGLRCFECGITVKLGSTQLNVPIHFTVKGICHMKGPRFVSGVREVMEVMDSDDHRFVPLADVLRL